MNPVLDTKLFYFGVIAHLDFQMEALAITELEDELNRAVSDTEIPQLLKEVYFIPMLLPASEQSLHEEEVRYEPEVQKLFVRKRIPENDSVLLVFQQTLASLTETDYPELLPLQRFVEDRLPEPLNH